MQIATTATRRLEIADALVARDDLFRVMLGASYPGHQDHFHLDMSTFRMIEL